MILMKVTSPPLPPPFSISFMLNEYRMSTMQLIYNYLNKSKTYAFDGKLNLNLVDWKF